MIYFDHNATAPMSVTARDAWLQAAAQWVGNPSSPHRLGDRAHHALQEARARLARILGCDPLDVIWTSGATESNNAALHHFWRRLRSDEPIWIFAAEHPSMIEPARRFFGRRLRWIPARASGEIELEWIARRTRRERPGAMAVMAANNETGVLQPWRQLLEVCREYKIPFACDATQSVGKIPAAGLGGCDFVTGSAHKFGGPRGVGFLKCPAGVFEPLHTGGPQQEGRRAGTENVPAVLSMLAALEERERAMAAGEISVRERWRAQFEAELKKKAPGATVIAAGAPRLWNTTSVLMPVMPGGARWVVKLDKLGFAVSTGSACASGKEAPSHVLRAMGLDPAEASRALRISSGWETAEGDWRALTDAIGAAYDGMKTGRL